MTIALAALTSCGSHEGEHKHENIRFTTTSPIVVDTTITKEYVCQIHAIQHIELRALEKGYLQRIFVDEGQSVKEGTVMFRIMPMVYQAEAQIAQAELELAEIEYKNTKALADSQIVSKNELAMAKANYDKAKARLNLANVHLGFTEIKAPFSGIMDRFHVRVGSLLDEGELLTSLSDNSKMWVYFNVPEVEYLNYMKSRDKEEHATVLLRLANGDIFESKGIIETIEADFNNETGNISFRAAFDNSKGLLRHGETGNILLNNKIEHAMLIPQKATFEVLDKKFVYVVDKDNIVRSREVKIAQEIPHMFVISKGLKVGDRILLEGLRKVRENEKIKFTHQDPKKVMRELDDVYAE